MKRRTLAGAGESVMARLTVRHRSAASKGISLRQNGSGSARKGSQAANAAHQVLGFSCASSHDIANGTPSRSTALPVLLTSAGGFRIGQYETVSYLLANSLQVTNAFKSNAKDAAGETLPCLARSTAFAAKTLPLPCVFHMHSWLRRCLCLAGFQAFTRRAFGDRHSLRHRRRRSPSHRATRCPPGDPASTATPLSLISCRFVSHENLLLCVLSSLLKINIPPWVRCTSWRA